MIDDQTKTSENDRRKVADYEEYWNSFFDEKLIAVNIMESAFSDKNDEMLVTTVGRGIAVCLNNNANQGALAHIISHPIKIDHDTFQIKISDLLDTAINKLEAKNDETNAIKAKLFGGGQLAPEDKEENAQRVYDQIRTYLEQKNIPVSMEDIGNSVGRRIYFFSRNGKVVRRILQRKIDRDTLIEREHNFSNKTKTD